jgi:S-adenosyl methyltransferase
MGWEPISLEVLAVPAGDTRGGSLHGSWEAALDTRVAHPARVYDYWLGGKDNYAADREAGELTLLAYPQIRGNVRSNRAFLRRAVRYLADRGIRQFLDIGTGLPSADNTHEVAQRVAPECRVVYADNDPIVLSHARALLASAPEGACAYLDADLRDTGKILAHAATQLDLNRPVAVILLGILQLIEDADDPYAIVGALTQALCPGSYLMISHPTGDIDTAAMTEMARRLNERSAPARMTLRTYAQIARFFDGLRLAEPGLVPVNRWRPDLTSPSAAADVPNYCAVARKP